MRSRTRTATKTAARASIEHLFQALKCVAFVRSCGGLRCGGLFASCLSVSPFFDAEKTTQDFTKCDRPRSNRRLAPLILLATHTKRYLVGDDPSPCLRQRPLALYALGEINHPHKLGVLPLGKIAECYRLFFIDCHAWIDWYGRTTDPTFSCAPHSDHSWHNTPSFLLDSHNPSRHVHFRHL